jgi:hypothetical protein
MICAQSFAQGIEKKYKYVIVPLQYNFTSKPNQFQLNVLTRVMLQQEGFEVYMSEGEEIPEYVANNQCSYLRADVKRDSKILSTSLRFQLFNCFGSLVYESIGTSREKAFGDAYKEALREALAVFQTDSYKLFKTDESEDDSEVIEIKEVKTRSFEERSTAYLYNEKEYRMIKESENYIFYEDMGETVWATLKFVDKGTYSFDSENIDGAAYFTPEGNIVVEYLSKNKDAVQKMVLEKQ